VVVPHPGDVDDGLGQLGGQLELHRDAGLHVDGAAAPEILLAVDRLVAGRQIVVQRHRVDVAGDHHPLGPAEVRARHDGVAVADDLEMTGAGRLERRDDRVGEQPLVPGHRLDVADLLGEHG
jgi:hypothetical protein